MFEAHIASQIQQREDNALLRRRLVCELNANNRMTIGGQGYVNFSSNDYLAIAQDSTKKENHNKLLKK